MERKIPANSAALTLLPTALMLYPKLVLYSKNQTIIATTTANKIPAFMAVFNKTSESHLFCLKYSSFYYTLQSKQNAFLAFSWINGNRNGSPFTVSLIWLLPYPTSAM